MKNLIYLLVFALTAFLFVYSCSTDEDDAPPPAAIVKKYTLAVTAGEGGTVSTSGGTYSQGTQVSITATPSTGFTFSQWSDGSTTNPITVTLNSNTNLSASFTAIINSYTLTVTAGEGGTVSTEGGTYDEGTEVTITATPEEGYEFAGWSNEESNISLNIKLTENVSIQAIFQIKLPSYERYSSLNERTSHFNKQKYFYRYLNNEESLSLKWIINQDDVYEFLDPFSYDNRFPQYRVHGSYHSFGDFDNDSKLDFFGTSWKFTEPFRFGNEKTQHIFISNYFEKENQTTKILESSYINWAAPLKIADFDNDGFIDIWISQNNRHNNSTKLVEEELLEGVENYNEGIEPGTGVIIFFGDNSIEEIPVGPTMESHQSTIGDIDNDGDMDLIIFSWTVEGELGPGPKIVLNDGNRMFRTINLLEDNNAFMSENIQWSVLQWNVFDIDGDGNMDILGSTELSNTPTWEEEFFEYYDDHQKGFHNNRKAWILWGSEKLQFESKNIQLLDKPTYRMEKYNSLGSAFTDYDSDGDIDLILLTSAVTDEVFYGNYELILFENKGDRIFEDVTTEKIDGYFSLETKKFGEMYDIVLIDKDDDGDFDIVPYANGDTFGSGEQNLFLSNLYWENTGGKFVRREND